MFEINPKNEAWRIINQIYIERNISLTLTPQKMEYYLKQIDKLLREENLN